MSAAVFDWANFARVADIANTEAGIEEKFAELAMSYPSAHRWIKTAAMVAQFNADFIADNCEDTEGVQDDFFLLAVKLEALATRAAKFDQAAYNLTELTP